MDRIQRKEAMHTSRTIRTLPSFIAPLPKECAYCITCACRTVWEEKNAPHVERSECDIRFLCADTGIIFSSFLV